MSPSRYSLPPLLQLLRPHQWSKNVLLFFPVILAHRVTDTGLMITTAIAATLFSLMASAVYVFNDYIDLEADRQHPQKCKRPLAAGTVSLKIAPWISLSLATTSLLCAFLFFPVRLGIVLLVYVVANLIYSGFLKQVPILDAVFLTLMFLIRIYAGGVAGQVLVTGWLFTFCLFFFLSIAFAKRVQELKLAEEHGPQKVRGYLVSDLPCISQLGTGSGLICVLVLALYIHSGSMVERYRSPYFLWLLCPLILYWVGRFWLLTLRGEMEHDPIAFTLKDRISYLILLSVILVVQGAYWF
ncbi:UbiA family prenyltransferase [Kiritimatiellota bacterium B12222]|nr:UbiA family prenyltransferase [Kiritimatiellota bacterium B12222]